MIEWKLNYYARRWEARTSDGLEWRMNQNKRKNASQQLFNLSCEGAFICTGTMDALKQYVERHKPYSE